MDEHHRLAGEVCIVFKQVINCLKIAGYSGQLLFETKQTRALPGSTVGSGMLRDRWLQLMQK